MLKDFSMLNVSRALRPSLSDLCTHTMHIHSSLTNLEPGLLSLSQRQALKAVSYNKDGADSTI